ncbi:hypothetical protein [Halosimplex amylolyticum]|uniref:hypothetical protein n=1 Tax=Halosimplex amylolyticum TaxID=3396616 RepID=UPI003F55C5A5
MHSSQSSVDSSESGVSTRLSVTVSKSDSVVDGSTSPPSATTGRPVAAIEQWSPNRVRDAVFARALVVVVGWTLTAGRQSIRDGHEGLVFARIGVAAVPDEDAFGREDELEGFVLGTPGDAGRKVELFEWVHGSPERPDTSAPPIGAQKGWPAGAPT